MCSAKVLPAIETTLAGFNGCPPFTCHLIRPERYHQLIPQLPNCIARGAGASYSDAAINTQGFVVSTARLNRFLAFDREQGILTAEAGVTLKEICDLIVPAGWFLPVTAGTLAVSLGGAVAADIHGKNHFHQGTFSQHVIWLELMTASLEKIRCSATEQAELFWATVGGMGLTGFIGTVCLKLKRMPNPHLMVQNTITMNLEQTLTVLNETVSDYEYSVAWLDGQAKLHQLGKGVVMAARHADSEIFQAKDKSCVKRSFSIPFKSPANLINAFSIGFFNRWYYASSARKTALQILHYQDYFYPLDKIKHWPYLYGKKGFIQYQCVFPLKYAAQGIEKLLALFQRNNILCSLVVLKRFGKANKALLSFAKEGITIAIDMPFSRKLLRVLNQADELVVEHEGRIYLAKDTRLSKAMFTRMYPDYLDWIKIKKKIDPDNVFQSSLSSRLLWEM